MLIFNNFGTLIQIYTHAVYKWVSTIRDIRTKELAGAVEQNQDMNKTLDNLKKKNNRDKNTQTKTNLLNKIHHIKKERNKIRLI